MNDGAVVFDEKGNFMSQLLLCLVNMIVTIHRSLDLDNRKASLLSLIPCR